MNNSDVVTIGQIKTLNGQRVVTFKDIDMVHGKKDGTARRNFNRNKKHFVNGVDYVVIPLMRQYVPIAKILMRQCVTLKD